MVRSMTAPANNLSYDVVVWDWNGTLLDDIDLVINIVNEIFVDNGVEPMSLERYKELFDFPVQDYYRRAGVDFSMVDYEILSERFHDHFERRIESVSLFPEATDTLRAIRRLGARQFLLSSTEHGRLQRMVADFDIDHLFDHMQGIEDGLARGKVEAGSKLIDSHGITGGRSVMIGDTRHDFEVAQAFGMDCILLATGHQSHARLAETGCPVFDCVSEIPVYLANGQNQEKS